MSLPVCLRALVLIPAAATIFAGNSAGAKQPELLNDGKKNSDTSVSNAIPGRQTGKAQQGQEIFTDQKNNSGTEITPAEQRYGLPRVPLIGGPVNLDLSKPLSLMRAVRIGLQRQNSIAIAQTQVDSAEGRVTQARSSYFPQVTPSFQFQTALSPSAPQFVNGQRFSGVRRSETRTEILTARQTIYDSGVREANVGNTRRSLFASEYGLGNERQNVILNITENYYTLLRDKELVRVQDESVKRAETTLDSINKQIDAGAAAKSDRYQSEADLANAKVARLQAVSNYRVVEAALKNSMGIVSSQPLILTEDKAAAPDAAADTISLERYVQTAYVNRLDVKQQQERIYAQGYNVRISRINNGVTLNSNVTEGYQLNPDAGETRQFNVAISYPLFDGGNTRAALKESKSQYEQEKRSLDQLQQNVRLNVDQSYSTREQARQSYVASTAAVEAGTINKQAADAKLKAGLINILDVLNAEVQLVNAQVSQVNSIYDFYIADARLKRDIGLNDPIYLPKVPGARPPIAARP